MADCLIAPVKSIATDCVWPCLKPHFEYWWYFDNNIQGLEDEIKKLEIQKMQIERSSEDAKEWLKESTKWLAEARKILDDNVPIPMGRNLKSRYSMGKKAKKTTEEIGRHLVIGEFYLRAGPALPAMDPSPAPPAMDTSTRAAKFDFKEWNMEFESRKSIEEQIIKALKDRSLAVIGLCGMAGAGKTIMANRIGKTVHDKNLFEEVLIVTVSQKVDETNIQTEIAKWLGLNLNGEDIHDRASQLRSRLTDTKRKIIILDDVWESLRFEKLGIPVDSDFEKCKVLLTSRSRETCNPIKNKMVFELGILEKEDAWKLFREKVGECVEDPALHSVGQDVVAECKGLPIALVHVGICLHDVKDCDTWDYSLLKLKENEPPDLQVGKHVYQSLKLSYDKLDGNDEKYIFLLCCLFPEDCNIPVRELTWCCMGLQIFGDITIDSATIMTQALVGKLKKRYLLIEGRDKLHVKMHDVVRDVAIYIGSKEMNPLGFLKSLTSKAQSSYDNCNWMSVDISNGRMEGPLSSQFPELRLLMLLNSSSIEFSDISLEGMKTLNVLSFQSTWIGSLPPKLGLLKHLQTLSLVNCKVKNISVIGDLTSLKIFSCYECENITELPTEIKNLSGLRLLELNGCPKLQRIPFGIISSLSRLEELKIRRSFSEWEKGGDKGNAAVTELGSLLKLACLEIEISDQNLAAQKLDLSSELVKYWIRIGSDHNRFEQGDYRRVMILNLLSHTGVVEEWIKMLVTKTEYLSLEGECSNNFNIAQIANLRNLSVGNCSTLKKLVETNTVFGSLETLKLWGLNKLEEICEKTIIPNHLKSIHITSCFNLRYLFSVSIARKSLSHLEVLEIQHCAAMEQVFGNEIRDHADACIEFPKLKKLILVNLPNLTAFCQGLENIANFPNLTEMEIRDLPNLKYSVFPLNSETLCNLKSIKIVSCSIFRTLFSEPAAGISLLLLEVLEIADCDKLEQVFWNESGDNPDAIIELPNLKKLKLVNLQNFTAFSRLENIIKFPKPTEIEIANLPKLKRFSSQFRNT